MFEEVSVEADDEVIYIGSSTADQMQSKMVISFAPSSTVRDWSPIFGKLASIVKSL